MKNSSRKIENLNILVVEDDEASYMLIEEILSDLKLNIIHTHSGEEAVSIIVSETPLHLAIVDMRLSLEIDGLQLTSFINNKRPKLSVIVQSGASLSESQQTEISALKCEYFTKPFDLALFLKSVNHYLE
jgi:DNA-binding NtrC family response regulator